MGIAGLPLLAALAVGPSQAAERSIAITFDDLPFVDDDGQLAVARDGTRRLLLALRERRAPAIGFVNEDKLSVPGEREARTRLLEDWLDAGMDLGNHNYGHVGFQTTPLAEYQAAVLKGEVVTRALLERRGRAPRYYRHPFTQTGPTREAKAAFESFLDQHGYAVAPFTVEHADYAFAALYRDALLAADAAFAQKLVDAYLAHLDTMLEFFEAESRELFGREIPQIRLIHANRLNAATLRPMLDRMRARGYRFVTLDEALRDPAYRSPDDYVGPAGPSWLHRFFVARGRGMSASLRSEPDPPQFVLDAWKARAAPREEEVRLPGPAGRLAGTLTLPSGSPPFATVVTLTGSGAHHRDGNRTPEHPYRPFRQIAQRLAGCGVATLRLDDRGVGGSEGDAARATLEDTAADAAAALRHLRGRGDVDGRRLALIGHSYGGEVAPLVAASDGSLAALVLLGAPARSFRETMRYQHRYRIASDASVAPEQREAALQAAMRQQDQNVAASAEAWRRSIQERDPLPTARRLRLPVLILHGLTDRAVDPGDASLLEDAIRKGGNPRVERRMFPDVNHHFQRDPVGAREGYDALPTQDLAPEVLASLCEWLRKALVSAPAPSGTAGPS